MKVEWLPDVVVKDYTAAYNYLSILLSPREATALVRKLKLEKLEMRRANDLLRASHREPAPVDDPGVEKDLARIRKHVALSPVLIVSFKFGADIADGYHRVSAAYSLDPYASVPCRIASLV